jgi:hypothetical protein
MRPADPTLPFAVHMLGDDLLVHLFHLLQKRYGPKFVLCTVPIVCVRWAEVMRANFKIDALDFFGSSPRVCTGAQWLDAAASMRGRVMCANATRMQLDWELRDEETAVKAIKMAGGTLARFGMTCSKANYLTPAILRSVSGHLTNLVVLDLSHREHGQCNKSLLPGQRDTFVAAMLTVPTLTCLVLKNWTLSPAAFCGVCSQGSRPTAPLRTLNLLGMEPAPFADTFVAAIMQAFPTIVSPDRVVIPGFGEKAMGVCCNRVDKAGRLIKVTKFAPTERVASFDYKTWSVFAASQAANLVHLDLQVFMANITPAWVHEYVMNSKGNQLTFFAYDGGHGLGLSEHDVHALAQACRSLKTVLITEAEDTILSGNVLKVLTSACQVTHLELHDTAIHDEDVTSCCEALVNLEHLSLSSSDELGGECFTDLALHCPRLTYLNVGHCLDVNVDEAFTIGQIRSLRVVVLGPGNADDDAVFSIASNCPDLEYLGLAHCCYLSDVAVPFLFGKAKKLQEVDLSVERAMRSFPIFHNPKDASCHCDQCLDEEFGVEPALGEPSITFDFHLCNTYVIESLQLSTINCSGQVGITDDSAKTFALLPNLAHLIALDTDLTHVGIGRVVLGCKLIKSIVVDDVTYEHPTSDSFKQLVALHPYVLHKFLPVVAE